MSNLANDQIKEDLYHEEVAEMTTSEMMSYCEDNNILLNSRTLDSLNGMLIEAIINHKMEEKDVA